MAQREGSRVTIEKTPTRVILKVDSMELKMTPVLARELGEKLYKCGCDVEATAQQ